MRSALRANRMGVHILNEILNLILHTLSMADSMTSSAPQTVAIVGGGPVGALASLYFAKHFSKVTLYELRPGLVSLDPLPPLIAQTQESLQIEPRCRTNRLTLRFLIAGSLASGESAKNLLKKLLG